ncbi:hypothetical protein H4582DRAFT_1978360 [Lactarius indigo]|nr:hypothetical protein H4582DRAFT_2007971 [Lactarius indigo]KAI9434522.1 hypothetical protein H4582DRAFT_1978360 [Lactarius indigo]
MLFFIFLNLAPTSDCCRCSNHLLFSVFYLYPLVFDSVVLTASTNNFPMSSSPRSIYSGCDSSPKRYRSSSRDSDTEVTA